MRDEQEASKISHLRSIIESYQTAHDPYQFLAWKHLLLHAIFHKFVRGQQEIYAE